MLLDRDDKIIPGTEEKLARWNEYIQELFDDDRHRERVEEDSKVDKYPAEDIGEFQFGFRDDMRTRKALFAFNVFTERWIDCKQPMYVCFLDYNKAFDKVCYNYLIKSKK